MAKKYLDYDGLLYFWQKIKTLFVPVTRTVNSKALSADISLTAPDVGAAPTSHKSTATTYGVGDSSNYGHLKLSDSTSSTTSTTGGTAATPKAVKDALDAAKSYADGLDTGVSDVKVDNTSVVTSGVANINTFTGATSSADGSKGLVKAPLAGSNRSVLFGDASWRSMSFDSWLNIDGGCGFNLTFDDDNSSQDTKIEYDITSEGARLLEASPSNRGFMSSADKTKLNGIAAGAEANVQSDWNVTDTTSDAFIKNKPTIPTLKNVFGKVKVGSSIIEADTTQDTLELVGGINILLTPDATNDKVTIEAINTTYSAGTADFIEVGTDTANRVWTPKVLHDYVTGQISTAVTGAVAYQGIAPTSFAPTNYKAGWYWIIGTAGTYVGQVCEAGDMIFCKTAASAYSAANFDVVQTNLDITSITNAEIDTILAA